MLIEIPDVGAVEFPDGLSDDELSRAAASVYSQTRPDELGIGQEVRGVGRAVQRGALQGVQALDTMRLASETARPPRDSDSRRAFLAGRLIEQEQALYGGRPERIASLEQAGASTPVQIARQISGRQQRIDGLPASPDLANLRTDFWRTLATNPVETIATVVAESLPQAAPGIVGAALGGGPLAVGANSFGVEYANTLLDAAGPDVLRDPEALARWFAVPANQAAAKAKAVKRGLPVAAFDAATAGLAGRFLKPALGQGMRPVAVASAKELGTQMAGGMAGETAGQLASEGRVTSVPDIVLEGIAELGSAPGEVLGNLRGERRGGRPSPVDTRTLPIPSPVDPAVDELPDFREVGSAKAEVRSEAPAAPVPTSNFRLPTLPRTDAGLTEAVDAEGFTVIDQAVAFGRRTGRPLDPFATDQGVGENVPAEGIDVVGMGRRVVAAPAPVAPAPRRAALNPFALEAGKEPGKGNFRTPVDQFLAAGERERVEGRKATAKASQEFDRLLIQYGPELGWVDNLDALAPQMETAKQDGTTIAARVARSKELNKLRYRAAAAFGLDAQNTNLDVRKRAELLPRLQEYVQQEVIPRRQAESLTAAIQPAEGKQPVNTSDLSVGDVLYPEGREPVRVDAVDPDTGEVTLQDGTKFGRTVVADGQTLYVENVEPVEAGTDFAPEETNSEGAKARSDNSVESAQVAKQPWQMTGQQYMRQLRVTFDTVPDQSKFDARKQVAARRNHEVLVRAALKAGKPVPAEVLVDYPDLGNPTPVFDAPESVADQNARLERETAQAKTKTDREKLAERQAKPLTGSVGDIGQGDLLGGGDLFSAPSVARDAGSPYVANRASADSLQNQWTARETAGSQAAGAAPSSDAVSGQSEQGYRQQVAALVARAQALRASFPRRPNGEVDLKKISVKGMAEVFALSQEGRDTLKELSQLGWPASGLSYSQPAPRAISSPPGQAWARELYAILNPAVGFGDQPLLRTLAKLEALKVDTQGKVFDAIQGIPVLVWNGALSAAQLAIRAGQRVAQAIDAALAHIRARHRGAFDEAAVRAELEKSLGQRQFAEQIDAAPDVAQPVKDATTNRFYTRKPNEDTAAFAGRIIAGVGGPQNAVAVFTDTTNGLGGAERTMLGQLIVKQLSAAGQHEAAARFLDDTFLPYSTEAAQALQAFAAFANLTPEGALIYAKRLFNRTQRQPRERIQPVLDSAVDTLADLNQQGIAGTVADPQVQTAAGDLVTDAVLADGTKPGSAVRRAILVESANGMRKRILLFRGTEAPRTMLAKLTGRDGYWKALVGGQQKALTGALLKALGLKPTDQLVSGSVSQLAGDLGRILRQQMDAVLAKPGQPVTPRSARSQLLTLLANSERLSEVWAGVRTQLEAEGKTDPNVIRMLNTTVDVWSKPLLASVAREYLKTADVTLAELVRNHYIEVAEGQPSPTLTAKIVDWLGVTPEEAKPLAQAFDTVLREEAEKIRKGLRKRVDAVKRDPRWKRVLASGLAGPETMSDVDVDAAIAQAIREQRVNLGRLVREHYRTVNATGRSLADAVAATAGVAPDVAERFARVLRSRFAERVNAAKAAAIGRLEQAVAVPREVKQVWQRLVELSNLGALDRDTAWNAVAEKLKLPQWTPAIAKEVAARAEAIAQTPEGIFRQRRIVELHNYLAKQTGVPVMDTVLAFWYANTLSGPTTQAVNLLANVQNLTANLLVAARSPRDFAAQLAAVGRGLQQGGREAGDVLRTGILTRPGNTKLAASRPLELLTLPGRLDYLLTPYRLVGRALAAGDSLFFHAGQESRAVLLARQLARSEGLSGAALQRRVAETLGRTSRQRFRAVRQAMREGLSGQDLARRVDDLTQQQRPEGLNENARDYALRLTFNQNPYGLLGAIAHGINWAGAQPFGLPLRLIVPFTNVVANVANEALNYVPPIGVARAAWGHWKGTLEGQPITDRNALGDQWAKATLGTVLLGVVWSAAEAGLDDDDPWFMVNGAGPREFNKKNQLRAGGWIPFSLKLGDRYVSYSNSPAAMALAAVGNYFDARRYRQLDEQDAWNRVAYAFTTMGKVILEQSFLDGIARIVGSLDRDNVNAGKQLAQSLGRTAGNFVIPNAVRQVDRIFDPTVYDAPTTEAALVNSVPFARRLNRPALNVWGEPVRNEVSKRFGSSATPDPLLQLLARRQLWVSAPSSTQTEHRNGQPMTPDEFYEFTRHRGQILRDLLKSEGLQRTLDTAPQETAERIWRRLQTAATERAKSKVARR